MSRRRLKIRVHSRVSAPQLAQLMSNALGIIMPQQQSGDYMTGAGHIVLFYSYSHKDESMRDELATHLALMRRRGLIDDWHDRKILPGQEWSSQIDAALEEAEIVLLLVSADFIASDYCYGIELNRALERQEAQLADLVPVIIRPVHGWQSAPFGRFQAVPKDGKPVSTWSNRDEAWTDVAVQIDHLVQSRHAARAARPPLAHRDSDDAAMVARAVETFSHHTEAASAAKNLAPEPGAAHGAGSHLAELTGPRTVLWVDDNPENNRYERNALYAMQIRVDLATSTDEALQRLSEREPVHLVITDWHRDPQPDPHVSEGIRLLRHLHETWPSVPRVVYHGEFDTHRAAVRDREARALGAIGATAHPDVLMNWCVQALQADTSQREA
jgi:CheY-like chemotaxis protein